MNDRHIPDEESSIDDSKQADISANITETSGIQIDSYGIKFRIEPTETGEPDPQTWKEVGTVINQKLRSIAVNLFGVVGDAVVGTRMILRGVSRIPNSVADRIEKGHDKADRIEGQAQEQAQPHATSEAAAAEALAQIEAIILKKQAEGFGTRILDLGDGREALVFVKPEDLSIVGPMIQKALPPPAKGESKPPRKPKAPRTRKPKSQS